jgi:hypothetical protein
MIRDTEPLNNALRVPILRDIFEFNDELPSAPNLDDFRALVVNFDLHLHHFGLLDLLRRQAPAFLNAAARFAGCRAVDAQMLADSEPLDDISIRPILGNVPVSCDVNRAATPFDDFGPLVVNLD